MTTPFLSGIRSGWHWLSNEAGLRFIARRKISAAVAILTLALALGANTAVVSAVKAFLIASIGVPDADRVVVVTPQRDLVGRGTVDFSDALPNYELLRDWQHTYSAIAAAHQGTASWDDRGEIRPLNFASVSATFFATMKVAPFMGQAFGPKDEGPNPAPFVVISHALWKGAMGSDPSIVGKSLTINGAPATVVGVMPEGFQQPAPTDIWVPFDLAPGLRTIITGGRVLSVFGRLADGKSLAAAESEMRDFTKHAIEVHGAPNKDYRYRPIPLRKVLLNGADETVILIQAGVAVLLLLAILNVAALLLAWGFERRQELAVRIGLGAPQWRVTRMLLAQSVVVVVFGGLGGLVVARVALYAFHQLDLGVPVSLFVAQAELDSGVLAISAVVALIAGLAAGVAPAWFTRGAELSQVFRSASRSTTLSPGALRLQKGMVVIQSALSVTVLAAAALMGVSFWHLMQVPGGFVSRDRLVVRADLPDARYGDQAHRMAFASALATNIASEPAIRAWAFTSTLPVSDTRTGGRFSAQPPDGSTANEPQLVHYRRISPNYLQLMGIPLVHGRYHDAHDDTASTMAIVVSQAVATHFWPGEDPIGKPLFRTVGASWVRFQVIGTVQDVRDDGYGLPGARTVYSPYGQVSSTHLSFVIDPRGAPDQALAAMRRAMRATDRAVAPSGIATLDDLVRQANALPRLRALILLVFGIVAIAIVALGSFGVMSQMVSSREREYALRLVFGAVPKQLGGSVLLEVTKLTLPGIAAGIVGAWALGASLQTFVVGVEPRSAAVLASVGVIVLALAVVATAPSAIRAARVDPRDSVAGS